MPQITIDEAMRKASQHHQAGRLAEAEKIYRQILARHPNHAEALHLLGVLAAQVGNPDAAIDLITRSTQIRPDSPEAYANLGSALAGKGRTSEAIAALRHVIQLTPNNAQAYHRLATVLRGTGQVDEAIAAYRAAIQLRPDWAAAHFDLGNVLSGAGRFQEGLEPFRRAIELKPDYIEAHNHLGVALAQLERFDEAMLSHQHALSLMSNHAPTYEAMGFCLTRKPDMEAAVENFRRALELSPNLASSWNGLGAALQSLGRFDEATDCFRRALGANPNTVIAYRNLIGAGRQVADADEVQKLNSLLSQPNLPLDDQIAASFALGKLLDESDHFDEAFARFAQANLLSKHSRAAAGERFEIEIFRRQVDQIIETCTPEFFAERQEWGQASEVPVFVVGMPRSGTTLIEQIAASHPDVFGAGELKDISRIADALGGDAALGKWERNSITKAATTHIEHLRTLDRSASRIIDKMPDNVLKLGLIAALFPLARVIICRRDARDNCLSCFFQWFSTGNLFAYDLEDCGRRYLEIDRLTRHWLSVLPLKMLEVQYEELVGDLEGQSRRLINFLGLPWDPTCLEFHKTQRTVLTASSWQVRQPIYTRSVGRWRHYEQHLKPLLDVLAIRPK